ncbi:hypothetical protein GCM10008096_29280 [Zhihengliuella salsuginis]|uniref:Uncharacterized protein n=1 Tax=Zhihengliuella salsuginis TaxID=578222 RepID=A0ABQ3GMK0_9MICC|nr:hypothetical protein GCM10008096_29280 [Zhihengliuella salsuginis]
MPSRAERGEIGEENCNGEDSREDQEHRKKVAEGPEQIRHRQPNLPDQTSLRAVLPTQAPPC